MIVWNIITCGCGTRSKYIFNWYTCTPYFVLYFKRICISRSSRWLKKCYRFQKNKPTNGLLTRTQNCGLHMPQECRKRFAHHWPQSKMLVSDQWGTSSKQHQAICIISSSYVNSNLRYSPETVKLGCDLCDLDLWPLTLTFCMDLTLVIGNN